MVSVQNNKSFCDPRDGRCPSPIGDWATDKYEGKGGTDNKAGNSRAASARWPQRLCSKPILAPKELGVLTRWKTKRVLAVFFV